MQAIIAVNPANPTPQPAVVLSLETISILFGIGVSASILIGAFIKIVSRFNAITNEIQNLHKTLEEHAAIEGHKGLIVQLELVKKDVYSLDKKLDLHLQAYVNRTETVQFLIGQLDQKIDHKTEQHHKKVDEVRGEVKEIEQFLQKHQSFVIRDKE